MWRSTRWRTSRAPVAAEIEKYLGSDLLFYRAEAPEGLIERQALLWDPVLDWARDELGARFVLAQGVMPVAAAARGGGRGGAENSDRSLAPHRRRLDHHADRLGLLALALAHGELDADAVWAAAHVDEDWQMSQWGRDELALERRAPREAEFRAAAAVLAHLR